MNTGLRSIAASIVALLMLVSCGLETSCENIPLSEAISPDGRRKIVVFSRECGATTGSNSQGAIIGVGDPYPTTAGTVFISDQDNIAVAWDQPTVITVKMDKGPTVFKQEILVDGVTIEYP